MNRSKSEINAHQAPGINLEIGGLVIKLLCPDPELYRRIQSSFRCFSGHQKPILALEVHSSKSHWGRLPNETCRLDGEGEYVAAFDPSARRAVIRLTGSSGSDAILALANFIKRIFARLIIDNNGAIFHSACVVRKRPGFAKGYAEASGAHIFFGKSGAGKSTVCELSRGAAIARHALRVASDDLTIIRLMGGRMLAWGLPAFGGRAQRVASARFIPRCAGGGQRLRSSPYLLSRGPFPIRAAFTLVQDNRHFVKRLRPTAAMAGMLALPADLSDPDPIAKTIDLLTRLVQSVPCYELHFKKDRAFWDDIDAEVEKQ
jgi:hypothetical protein